MDEVEALLIATVGGSPAPVIRTLKELGPACALFFCSASSAALVDESIVPALPCGQQASLLREICVLHDEQDLTSCVRDMRLAVQGLRECGKLAGARLVADFTGGTKVMSAALVMALVDCDASFVYVGGGQRAKNGLGTVLDGEERVLRLANPWQELAVLPVQRLADAFNACLFSQAEAMARELGAQGENRVLFACLADVARGYALWDAFALEEAAKVLSAAHARLLACAGAVLADFAKNVGENCAALELAAEELAAHEADKAPCPHVLQDLAANAFRRLEQGRFDDAAARFYSLLEKAAKVELASRHGLDTSHLDAALVPADFLARERPLVGHDGSLQLPLCKAWLLLAHLNNPLGLAFVREQESLEEILAIRNASVLAHGFAPVGEAVCRRLASLVMGFLGLNREKLTTFARLDARKLAAACCRG